LKIETQLIENHQAKLVVEAEPEELAGAKRKAARQIAQRIKIPGFRPGKAPYNVIERHVGEGTILEDAVELLAQELYPRALDDSGLKPYGPGTLDNVVSIDPPKFEFTLPLQAEVNFGNIEEVKIPYEPETVTEDEISQTLDDLRDRHAVIEPADRPAQESDLVRIILSGEREAAEDNQELVLVKERSLPVVIEAANADTANEWPFPGFSRQLIGRSANDEIELEHVFSDESPYETLRGVKAMFHVKVEQVSSRTLPPLDDEFALSVGEYQTLEALRTEISNELVTNKNANYNREYDDQVIGKIIEISTLKYPPQMVERELDDMLHDLEHRLEHQGLDMETYLKINQKTIEELRQELHESAENRLKRSLVLFEASRTENIKVSEAEIQNETLSTLSSLGQSMPEEEMRKLTGKDQIQNLVSNIMADLLVRKTLEHLRYMASDEKAPKPSSISDVDTEASQTVDEPEAIEQIAESIKSVDEEQKISSANETNEETEHD
jgi:trigger factor